MTDLRNAHERHRISERAAMYREHHGAFAAWAEEYGVITHDDPTPIRVYDMADSLLQRDHVASRKAA